MCGSSANVGSSVIKVRASGFTDDSRAEAGTWGTIEEMIVSIVWRGSSGTHVSIYIVLVYEGRQVRRDIGAWLLTHAAVGTNPLELDMVKLTAWLLPKLVVLFWREKVGLVAGSLPRAFSDIPRS